MAVWFITGCSSGIGESIARVAIQRGDKVIASSRDAASLSGLASIGSQILELDVNGPLADIEKCIEKAISFHGQIDVLVNNSGYAQFGSVEETDMELIEKQFQCNVFGVIKTVKAVLPYMRKARSGIILNIGSRASYDFSPYSAFYSSSKAAVENISLGLDLEIKQFGIRSILVEPGLFRTKLLSAVCKDDTKFPAKIDDYSEARTNVKSAFAGFDNAQPGDPDLMSNHLIDLVHKQGEFSKTDIPAIVTFGSDSIKSIQDYCEFNLERISKWEDFIKSTDRSDW